MKLRLLISAFVALGFIFVGSLNAAPRVKKTKATAKATISQTVQKVDINKADADTIASLKGIGPKKAQAIVAYRTKNGSFKSIDDLDGVKGISKKFIARLQNKNPGMIVVG